MKHELDINQVGTIVKGIDTRDISVLGQILTEGLKPLNKRNIPQRSVFTVVPDYSSFSMIGKRGYEKSSAAFLWGASDSRFFPLLTVVISPTYVRDNISDFIAAGEFFKKESFAKDCFEVEPGQLPYGLEYKEVETNHLGDLFGDEVLSPYVAPEAIEGIIAPKRYIPYLQEDIATHLSNKNLAVFDVSGKQYE